jgi:hypothetical protein
MVYDCAHRELTHDATRSGLAGAKPATCERQAENSEPVFSLAQATGRRASGEASPCAHNKSARALSARAPRRKLNNEGGDRACVCALRGWVGVGGCGARCARALEAPHT